jgi:EAL domain-containing protein (putative c-di-GMP-specific phosphodiesterase class I)
VVRSRDCRLIIKAVVELAHGLGLTATAEGVETAEQLALVRDLGCDLAQGYFISPPLEPAKLKAWRDDFLDSWKSVLSAADLGGDVEADALRERQL